MTVLPDWQIEQAFQKDGIVPWNEGRLQPASYDVSLSPKLLIPMADPLWRFQPVRIGVSKFEDYFKEIDISLGDWKLRPGENILGCTEEYVQIPDDIACRIEGKSTNARWGLTVHITAGYIDPGFRGNITMELCNDGNFPIILYPGMLIGQLSFSKLAAPARIPYKGKYQDAKGVIGGRVAPEPDISGVPLT